MNKTYKGFFKYTQGLKQGDHFSPCLFILEQEVLSRTLHKEFNGVRVGSFSHPRGSPLVSHLLYANDIMVFTYGERRSLNKLLEILRLMSVGLVTPSISPL